MEFNHFFSCVCGLGMEIVSFGKDDDAMFRWNKAVILNSVDLL